MKSKQKHPTNLDPRAFAHFRGHCIPRTCTKTHRCSSSFIQCASTFCVLCVVLRCVWAVVMRSEKLFLIKNSHSIKIASKTTIHYNSTHFMMCINFDCKSSLKCRFNNMRNSISPFQFYVCFYMQQNENNGKERTEDSAIFFSFIYLRLIAFDIWNVTRMVLKFHTKERDREGDGYIYCFGLVHQCIALQPTSERFHAKCLVYLID